jgi:hypothetical protein
MRFRFGLPMRTSPNKPGRLQMGTAVPADTRRPEPEDEPQAERVAESAPNDQHTNAQPATDKTDSGFDPTFIQVMSLLLVLLLLVKAYGVARFSLTTSAALVTAAPLSVLTGTLALYEYAFMAALAVAALWLFALGTRANDTLRRWTPLTFACFLFATLLSPPLYLYWTFGALAVSLTSYQVFAKNARASHLWMRLTRSSAIPSPGRITASFAALLAAGFLLITIDRPWLPAEVVALKSPIIVRTTGAKQHSEKTSRPVVYIVSEQNDETTMLVDDDRYLITIPTDDIAVRVICRQEGQIGSTRPLLWVILGRPYSSPNLECWRLTDQPEECPPPTPSRGPCPGTPPAVIKPP